MNTQRRRHQPPVARDGSRQPVGFSLLELVVVVLIIGIVAAIATPKFVSSTRHTEAAAIIQHVRIGHDAAEAYFAQHGKFPKDAKHGVFPSELRGYLPFNYFDNKPPGGEVWDWNSDGAWGDVYAGMSIRCQKPDLELWRAIDRLYDDNNLAKGWIRRYDSINLIFELVPKDQTP